MKNNQFRRLLDFQKYVLGVFIGSFLCGIGLSWFLLPYKIAPGGVGGLSQIFFHIFHWNAGMSMMLMNIPLWLMGILLIGKQFGMGTLAGFFATSAMTDILSPASLYKMGIMREIIEEYNTVDGVFAVNTELAMTDQIFLAAIAGSMLLGVGVGIMFRSKSSTGGTDIPAALLKKYFGISIGNGFLMIDTIIIILIGVVFSDLNIIIWSYFGLFLTAKFADMITEGLSRTKTATIICSSNDAEQRIKQRVYKELDRGCTIYYGEGGYSGSPKNILFVACNIQQTSTLKMIVRQEDPDVFMIMNDVHDVIGSRFKSRSLELAD